MPDRLLRVRAVAERLGLNESEIGRLIHSGKLPAKRLIARGTGQRPRLRVLESALQAFIEAMPDAVPQDQDQARAARPRRRATPRSAPVTNYY